MHDASIKAQVQRLLHLQPFRPFLLTQGNGDAVEVEHPQNIAFNPGNIAPTGRQLEFYVITDDTRIFNSFDSVTSVKVRDEPSNAV